MKIALTSRLRNWGPLRQLKSKLSGPYNKFRDGFRFLTIFHWRDPEIFHDLICFLSGKRSVVDLQTRGNEAHFRGLHFSYPQSGTQLEEIVYEIFVCRIYEGFGATLSKGDVVLDCGANIGLFTLYAQNRIGSEGKIICIEPVPDTYDLLIHNVSMIPVIKPRQFATLNLALSDKIETRTFVYSEERGASATGCVDRFDVARGTRGSNKTLDILCTSMDEIALSNLKTRIDFMKIDVEGMEKEAIYGGRETIRLFKPKCVISPHFDSREIVRSLKEIRHDYKTVTTNNVIYAW
jgi:FkbM family methyltransferase